jgi:alkanesulfonate monooxygenase
MSDLPAELTVLSTCPPSTAFSRGYRETVAEIARWSERAGCRGMLVYSDNNLLDPWLLCQVIFESTEAICPLVAVQPVYMHPYTVAKTVASLGELYRRRVFLNMVSGGFKNDLEALGDRTPHDRRYDRLVEYTSIVQRLLAGDGPVSLEGEFYRVDRLRLTPPLPAALQPEVFVSGSSEAGRRAARALGAVAVSYPGPAGGGGANGGSANGASGNGAGHPGEPAPDGDGEPGLRRGIRVGIIARRRDHEAWEVAHARFPADRRGQLTHQLAMKVSDSVWHRQLSAMAGRTGGSPYWLFPFENYKTMCPYLVGSYRRVGEELGRYLEQGARTVILDVPASEDELRHTAAAFDAVPGRRWRAAGAEPAGVAGARKAAAS